MDFTDHHDASSRVVAWINGKPGDKRPGVSAQGCRATQPGDSDIASRSHPRGCFDAAL